MTILEAKQALARKLNIDYSDISNNDLFTEADFLAYIQTGAQVAWERHLWDFAEGAKTAELSADNLTNGYVDYPQEMVTSGASSLVVNGEEFPEQNKIRYRDYIRWKRLNPNSTDRYWTEYKRFLFMNMAACAAGQTFDVYGKLRCPAFSADGDLLPFSPDADNQEDSGNTAIVKLAYAEALDSDKKKEPDRAAKVRVDALVDLDALWKPMKELNALQQTKDRPFFNVPDFFPNRQTSQRGNIGQF